MLNLLTAVLIAQATQDTTPYVYAPITIHEGIDERSTTIHEPDGDVTVTVKGKPSQEALNAAKALLDGGSEE